MEISWKEEVEKRKEEYLEDLKRFIRIPSVRDMSQSTPEHPVGPGPRKALDAFMEMAQRDGFKTKQIKNLVGRVELGEGDEILGILGHLDVVPVDDSWETDPFEPVIKDNKIYGRGASDDKGPLLACYYALKMVRDLNLPMSKKIHFIVGTDEESEWLGMKAYFESGEPMPDFGFSPDAAFPLINGEKGNYTVRMHFPKLEGALTRFEAGQKENMVPGDAYAWINGFELQEVQQAMEAFTKDLPVSGDAEEDGNQIKVHVHGLVSHGSTPELGHNAGTYLAQFLLGFDEAFNYPYLRYIVERIHLDTLGEKLNVAYHDDVMGDVSVNAGVFGVDEDRDDQIVTLNLRVPRGETFEELDERFQALAEEYGYTPIVGTSNEVVHYVDPSDPMIQTLLEVYNEHTGEKGEAISIGGGTYGRLMERGVAYGVEFPNDPSTMHEPNEYQDLDRIWQAMVIYADAIYRLVK